MTGEVRRLLEEALDVYRALGAAGYCDGELSLDNLGIVLDRGRPRVVLMDYGAVVNVGRASPTLLAQWLQEVRGDYRRSHQAYKLQRYAQGNPEARQAADAFVRKALELTRIFHQFLSDSL